MANNKKDRVAVYIDGSNTYNRLKNLGIPEAGRRFNFSAFVSHLLAKRILVSKRYYVGVVKNHDNSSGGEKRVKGQQKFLEGLRSEGFDIKLGRIMYDSVDRIREKGVDVKLAVDLVVGAVDDLYDIAIVISSDTDLIPAIQYAQRGKDKTVEYIGFAGSPSLGMIKETVIQRLFAKEDLKSFEE
jgi:uncharacterized LabA/DUF88 family protein